MFIVTGLVSLIVQTKLWALDCQYFLTHQFVFLLLKRIDSFRWFFKVPTTYVLVEKYEKNTFQLCTLTLFSASGEFCRLSMTFANSLNPDQARRNVGPEMDPNCLTL